MMPMVACDGNWGEGAPMPPQPLVGAALDTDGLVAQLVRDHREALIVWYVWTGPWELRLLDTTVPYETLRDRVRASKFELDELNQGRRLAALQRHARCYA